jgi:hypothetical protein
MAEDLSRSSDPAITEQPSPAARLIIMVGPDPPGEHNAGNGTPGRRARPARQAWEPRKDAEAPKARGQEGERRDQLNR